MISVEGDWLSKLRLRLWNRILVDWFWRLQGLRDLIFKLRLRALSEWPTPSK